MTGEGGWGPMEDMGPLQEARLEKKETNLQVTCHPADPQP